MIEKEKKVVSKQTKIGFLFSTLKESKVKVTKDVDECPCLIQIVDGVHSKGNKEIIAIALEDFFIKYPNIFSDGYRDTHSSMIREHMEKEFPMYSWRKNSSQTPFDVYSVDALVAIENKTANVNGRKRTNDFCINGKLVTNATIYPDKVKVKDVVPKKSHGKYSSETLEQFMDVLVSVVDKDKKTNTLVRYRIVDGSYWGIDYDTYIGAREFFRVINEKYIKKTLFDLVYKRNPNNIFIKRILTGELPGVSLDLRKLFMVDNPTKDLP